ANSAGASSGPATTPAASLATPTDQIGLLGALLFALFGGILLNLMPCVFPVLGIKIMNFARHAQSDRALLRKQGFAFLAGVLVSFWVLSGILIAVRSAGESIGWGFQLQSPTFVTLLATLFMLMALNLSGVFEMGLRLQAAAGSVEPRGRNTLVDAFLSGVLATVVATPCTAPMMGAALGFTLSQPAYLSILIFTAIGLGMALPILTLSLAPQWLRYLPKPGAWMATFRQFLAFPLFATVAWLIWVLGSQVGNDGAAKLLFGLVAVALAAWIYGHLQFSRPVAAILGAAIIALSGLALAWPDGSRVGISGAKMEDGWTPFTRQKIAELRGQHKAVFVDFTATWCITCQVNKRVALNQDAVIKRFDELDIVRMKADWTVKDAEITRTLAEFGRNGVPLYVYYPAVGEPHILPELLTPAIVLSAIEPGNASPAAR
ncbi:MAG: thioredoxin family protein, partial [Betaproteobacteria bacterium]